MIEEPSHLIASLSRRYIDLTTFQIPRLAECAGPKSLQDELVSELRDDLDQFRNSITTLADLGEEMDLDQGRDEVLSRADDMLARYNRARQSYRSALLTSNTLIRTTSRRQTLPSDISAKAGPSQPVTNAETVSGEVGGAGKFAVRKSGRSGQGGDSGAGRRGQEDPLQVKTHEVTDALRRTVDTMHAELERSVMATQMLDESTQTLRSTQSLYDRYTSLLQTSSKLVKQIESADWYDRLTIFFALAFFCLVVAFIVKRRVLDKAVRGVGWWVGGSYRLLTGGGRKGKVVKIVAKGVKDGTGQLSAAVAKAGEAWTTTGAALPLDTLVGFVGAPDATPEQLARGYPERKEGGRVEIIPHPNWTPEDRALWEAMELGRDRAVARDEL